MRADERQHTHYMFTTFISRACLVTLLTFCGGAARGETYIVPVWAAALPASDGSWWAHATAINPHDFPVTWRVTRVFPLQTAPCAACTGEVPAVTLAPRSAVPLTPRHLPGERLVAGAFEVEASAALVIDLVAYRPGATELRQRLDVARRWVPAGRHTISAAQRGGAGWRMNVFVVNPGDTAITVSVWTGSRAENEIRREILARTTVVMSLGPPLCSGVPCPFPGDFPPMPVRVEVDSTGAVLTSVSSITPTWAVFTLADEARH